MQVTRFDPEDSLIVIAARLWGPRGDHVDVSLAVDTGATLTLVRPAIVDGLGYSARHGSRVTGIRSAIGSERGYSLSVTRFAALGFSMQDFVVHVHELPGYRIDGLLGLSFLRQLNYQVRSIEGRLLVERAIA